MKKIERRIRSAITRARENQKFPKYSFVRDKLSGNEIVTSTSGIKNQGYAIGKEDKGRN